MFIRVLLVALFASWLAACESSGDGGTAQDPNDKKPDEFHLSDAWADDRDSLPELGGYTDLRPGSVIAPQAVKNYVLEPVMHMNRRLGQAIYNSPILHRLAEEGTKGEAKALYEHLFGTVQQGNQARYQKQLKCLADIHEIELAMQSLLVAAYDPALREGVFTPAALDELNAIEGAQEQAEYLMQQLWLEEGGKSDLTGMWQQYRNKVAAILVLPFGDEVIYSNTWSCALQDTSWEMFSEGPTFVVDVQDKWFSWRNADELITHDNIAVQLLELVELVKAVASSNELSAMGLGLMNRILLEESLTQEPVQNDSSHEGSLYRMAKLVCKGWMSTVNTETLCVDGEGTFVGKYQVTRDINEQVASNASGAISWLAYDGGLARELYEKYKDDRNARALASAILELKEGRLDPLPQRAFHTQREGGGKAGGCESTGLCTRSLLISVADASNEELVVSEKKPGINSGEGETAFPIDNDNKNVLRHDRVQHAMDELDKGVEEYLAAVSSSVDDLLGSWNHLITLLLITFGGLRLRSRRLA